MEFQQTLFTLFFFFFFEICRTRSKRYLITMKIVWWCIRPTRLTLVRKVIEAVANYRHFVSNERCLFERGEGRSLFVKKKIGIFGLLRVVLHDFPVILVTKKSIILQTPLTGRPSWPSLNLSTSSAELTRDLHDLTPSLALSVMRRKNGGRYAPTPLKKHENALL